MPDNPIVSYNIACVYALQNQIEDALKWLKKSVSNGFDNWNHIKNDNELKNIRNTSYFIALTKGK
jgi:hypothetical protein